MVGVPAAVLPRMPATPRLEVIELTRLPSPAIDFSAVGSVAWPSSDEPGRPVRGGGSGQRGGGMNQRVEAHDREDVESGGHAGGGLVGQEVDALGLVAADGGLEELVELGDRRRDLDEVAGARGVNDRGPAAAQPGQRALEGRLGDGEPLVVLGGGEEVVVLGAGRVLLGGHQRLLGGRVRVLEADADLHPLRRRGGSEPGGVGERQPVHGEPDAWGSGGAGGGRDDEQGEQGADQRPCRTSEHRCGSPFRGR